MPDENTVQQTAGQSTPCPTGTPYSRQQVRALRARRGPHATDGRSEHTVSDEDIGKAGKLLRRERFAAHHVRNTRLGKKRSCLFA